MAQQQQHMIATIQPLTTGKNEKKFIPYMSLP